jgi:hypothetical protein
VVDLIILTLVEYLMGHFTTSDVESFVTKHVSGWGKESFSIEMSWGYRQPLTADVVVISLRNEESEIGYHHVKTFDQHKRPKRERQKSLPLGIHILTVWNMMIYFREHLSNVTKDGLKHYVSITYDDQSSKFAESLLGSVCTWYSGVVDAKGNVRVVLDKNR